MNDKEKLLRDYARMCSSSHCNECSIGKHTSEYTNCAINEYANCIKWISRHPSQSARCVEKWVKEHPYKTRQDVFLERYPGATKFEDVIMINPCYIESKEWAEDNCPGSRYCAKCREDYWSQEVTE